MSFVAFQVTDAAEPYFLFTLDVGEDDFHELKRDQVCTQWCLEAALLPILLLSSQPGCTQNSSRLALPLIHCFFKKHILGAASGFRRVSEKVH